MENSTMYGVGNEIRRQLGVLVYHSLQTRANYILGITPEGINQNYVMYEFALERGWDHTPTNLEKWFQQYALGRYGQDSDFMKKAWNLLRVRKIKLH